MMCELMARAEGVKEADMPIVLRKCAAMVKCASIEQRVQMLESNDYLWGVVFEALVDL